MLEEYEFDALPEEEGENEIISDISNYEEGVEVVEEVAEILYSETSETYEEVEEGQEIEEAASYADETLISWPIEEAEEIPEAQILDASPDTDSSVFVSELARNGDVGAGQSEAAGSETASTDSILSELENLESIVSQFLTASDLSGIENKLDEMNDNLLLINQNQVIAANNQTQKFNILIGFVVAIFGAFLIYVAFSKIF